MRLLRVREVQERLRVSRACVYALIDSGQLPSVRIGIGRGTIRVDLNDLEAFVAARRTNERRLARASTPAGRGFVHLDADRLCQAWTGDA